MGRKITKEDFRKIRPRQDQIELAHKMAEKLIAEMKEQNGNGKIKNSITDGDGMVHGCLGEILVAEALGVELSNCRDYDLVSQNGSTIEVKTKRCNSVPRLEYEGSVAKFNPDQKCDYYVFTRIMEDFSTAWIIGGISREQFFKLAVQREVGQRDPNDTPGVEFDFRASCYNIVYRHVKPINYHNKKIPVS